MKNILVISAALLLMIPDASATKHIITASGIQFTPNSISNVFVGDTIRWVWMDGSHTTTSLTIPANATAWDNPLDNSNTSFEYTVAESGIYNYKCTPHFSMGMTGNFTASYDCSNINCDDADVCTIDTCIVATGCDYFSLNCDDADACTGIETCDPLFGCQSDTPLLCDDGDACNGLENCDPLSGCFPGTPPTCDDGDVCTIDACDPLTGCVSTALLCDDFDLCTTDNCDPLSGCTSTPIICDDADACTTDGCDPSSGCTTTSSVSLSITSNPATCGLCDGSAIVIANGGVGLYVYSWSNGMTTQNAINLCTGIYAVTVTDSNTCTSTGQVSISSPGSMTVTTSLTDVSCFMECDGAAIVNVSGGTPPYSYSWSNGLPGTATVSVLCAGAYSVSVTDSSGCIAIEAVTINTPAPISLNVSISICEGDSLLAGGAWQTLPGAYFDTFISDSGCDSVVTWLLTVFPVTIINEGVSICRGDSYFAGGAFQTTAGIYFDTLSASSGCDSIHITTLIVNDSVALAVDTIIAASCGVCNGVIDLVHVSGTDYSWVAGDTGEIMSGLCPGLYSVTATNQDGCIGDSSFTVTGNAACFDTISGTVYNDLNGNCIQDSAEAGIANVMIDLTPGGAAYTDANGYYIFIRDTGTYVVEQVLPGYLNQLCPAGNGSHTVVLDTVGIHSSGNNFYNEILPVQDLEVSLFCGVLRPGFSQSLSFTIHNAGNIAMSGHADFLLDSILSFLTTSGQTPAPDSIDTLTNTLYWNFTNLDPSQSLTFSFNVQAPAPPLLTLLDTATHHVVTYPLAGDADSPDNSASCSMGAIGSYDPNDKAVSPEGEGAEGNITQDDTLMYYTIRFQNTGTDTAFNIVIKDTLDSDLDFKTFKQGTASHPYRVHFEEDDVAVFTFENILLPDSNVNEPASHGHVTYYIGHDGELPIGTTINNSAAIYFDFNLPVITNTVTNKIYDPTGVNEVIVSDNTRIYPNPANDVLTVEGINSTIRQIFIMDIFGKRVYDSGKLNAPQHLINVKYLSAGVYILQTQTGMGQGIEKLVIH